MQKNSLKSLGLLIAAAATSSANAALTFDDSVSPEVIFGSGNANGSFTVDRSNNVELGLRGKLRFDSSNNPQNTFNSNGDGTYSFAAGLPPTGFGFAAGSPTTPIWNFEWSINSDLSGTSGNNLADFSYLLQIDFDSGIGTNFLAFDPINLAFADHAIGNNSTVNGGGVSATDSTEYDSLITSNNVAQNSWNMEFFNNAPFDIFDPTVDGTYDFVLSAFSGSAAIAETRMQVIVGAGAVAVPVPTTALLLGAGVIALGVTRRRKSG